VSDPEVTWSVEVLPLSPPKSRYRMRPVWVKCDGRVSWVIQEKGWFLWTCVSGDLSKEDAQTALDELRKEESR